MSARTSAEAKTEISANRSATLRRRVGRQDLQRRVTVRSGLVGPIDLAHPYRTLERFAIRQRQTRTGAENATAGMNGPLGRRGTSVEPHRYRQRHVPLAFNVGARTNSPW